ncbi:MAG: glycosyltransferase [Gemmatimonadota bacterium]
MTSSNATSLQLSTKATGDGRRIVPDGIQTVAVIGNYLPRRCGIATFTTDLCDSLASQFPHLGCVAIPVNDTPEGYEYPPRVRFELQEDEPDSYRSAAEFLNLNGTDIVCLQHEFGIFGGPAGSHVLALLRDLRMPVVTTLHTVPHRPDPLYRRVLAEVVELSDRVTVMSRRGRKFLRGIYGVPEGKIDLIPHGTPDVPFAESDPFKDQFGIEGNFVLLTFGLLSPNKGIEYVIEALPSIVERHPNVVYLVLGATHPHVQRADGESYRAFLQRLARSLGVQDHVVFHDRFARSKELLRFIGAADVYVTPYLERDQIVSGALAYTVAAGKAVVSTPYWYARELLADGRGVLVPFRDPGAIAEAIQRLIEREPEREAMRERAYRYGRSMIWAAAARRYMETMERALEGRAHRPRPLVPAQSASGSPGELLPASGDRKELLAASGDLRELPPASGHGRELPPAWAGQRELPPTNLGHLARLTDSTGLIQHAVFDVPNYQEGYTTDDNARALIVAVLLEEFGRSEEAPVFEPGSRYLAFLWYAFHHGTRRFRNVLAFDRSWREEIGSEDSHGRALWALGVVLGRSRHPGRRGVAARLIDQALAAVPTFKWLRPAAFTLLGLDDYLKRFPGDRRARYTLRLLAERLVEAYRGCRGDDWRWFEDRLTYANAKLPHALLVAGARLCEEDMTQAGLEALDWLTDVQRGEAGQFVPIGTHGFYRRGGGRARFDQQPLEAQATVSACLAAHRVTREERWRTEAWRAFEWFLGRNDLGLPLYDPSTGGCQDGLHPDRVNQNQGAESTLAFLQSLLELRRLEEIGWAGEAAPAARRDVTARRPRGRKKRKRKVPRGAGVA